MDIPRDGWEHIGPHPIRFEPPDIVLCQPTGVVTVEDLREGAAYLEKISKQLGHGVFYMADLSKLTRYAPQMVVHSFKTFPVSVLRGSVMFGANLYHRAVVDMILRAVRLLRLEIGRIPIASLADEAEARAWVEELRSREG
ncbi:hypothetical protein [Polyangium sp. 6x1]|uniref:hypothetical protein n=1 Tax=Polyangium sp. 6x1 TaxID=3042689 RepID=UPI002482A6B3|nr:hypothetical protein [Polyangium sp. 6x1]MDI1444398.1 hypothetical protein [Polyangium sp. 6x1]